MNQEIRKIVKVNIIESEMSGYEHFQLHQYQKLNEYFQNEI